ncbi:hypothetical protein BBP40_006090 [Aspergillus hancockii]|nr:hypothetical protein BBP40_006090 [Aspergillus hancockii]
MVVIKNDRIGGTGGGDFELLHGMKPVTQVECCLELFGTFNVDHPKAGDKPDNNGRVDGLRFTEVEPNTPTSDAGLHALAAGGHWGYKNGRNGRNGSQNLRNGTLISFRCKYGENIDSLGAILQPSI